MAIHNLATEQSAQSHATPVLHVSAYVDLPLPEVLGRLAPSEAAALLTAAFRAALDAARDVDVNVRAEAPVWVSDSHVRVPVSWSISRPSAAVSVGAATISLLVVQSGDEAITELLAVVPISPEGELRSTAELHEVLEQIARHLEAA